MNDKTTSLPPIRDYDEEEEHSKVTSADFDAEENGSTEDNALTVIRQLRERRRELQPFGKTEVLEVPGYEGLLAVEYNYIDADVTEDISKKVLKETKAVRGQGMTLLSSMDVLIRACKQILIRDTRSESWRPLNAGQPVKFERRLGEILNYEADDPREAVIGLFGSEHAIVQQNVKLSQWLTDVTRDVDDDFLLT